MRFEIIDQLLKLIDILIEFKCYLGSLAMFLILYQMIIENWALFDRNGLILIKNFCFKRRWTTIWSMAVYFTIFFISWILFQRTLKQLLQIKFRLLLIAFRRLWILLYHIGEEWIDWFNIRCILTWQISFLFPPLIAFNLTFFALDKHTLLGLLESLTRLLHARQSSCCRDGRTHSLRFFCIVGDGACFLKLGSEFGVFLRGCCGLCYDWHLLIIVLGICLIMLIV